MNLLLVYSLVYLLDVTFSDSMKGLLREPRSKVNLVDGILGIEDNMIDDIRVFTSTSKLSETATETTQTIDKKNMDVKMLLIATTKHSYDCNCSKNKTIPAETAVTEDSDKSDILNGTSSTSDMKKVLKRNNPEKRAEINSNLTSLCPYILPNKNFKMDKMVDVFWSKFYNMKGPLRCFNINVFKLTEMQKKRKEFIYGNFDGRVDWSRCHFEIQPPNSFSDTRHFLLGDTEDMGVMRNIVIKAESSGEFTLHEETPDQWVMLGQLMLLRDCDSGEVIVFTRALQITSLEDIVIALQHLGEQVIGKLLCDQDDYWAEDPLY